MPESNLKQLIAEVIANYGSLRSAGKALGVDYCKLQRLSHNGGLAEDNIKLFEIIRKSLKISKIAFWDKLTK